MEKYTFGGSLKSGESFFYTAKGEFQIEKDHQYLANPTLAELFEIFQKYPHLKPKTSPAGPRQTDAEEWAAHDDMVRRSTGEQRI